MLRSALGCALLQVSLASLHSPLSFRGIPRQKPDGHSCQLWVVSLYHAVLSLWGSRMSYMSRSHGHVSYFLTQATFPSALFKPCLLHPHFLLIMEHCHTGLTLCLGRSQYLASWWKKSPQNNLIIHYLLMDMYLVLFIWVKTLIIKYFKTHSSHQFWVYMCFKRSIHVLYLYMCFQKPSFVWFSESYMDFISSLN